MTSHFLKELVPSIMNELNMERVIQNGVDGIITNKPQLAADVIANPEKFSHKVFMNFGKGRGIICVCFYICMYNTDAALLMMVVLMCVCVCVCVCVYCYWCTRYT